MTEPANESMSSEEYRESHGAPDEETIHRACVEWATHQSAARPKLELLFHPRGGAYKGKAQAGRMVGLGGKAGVPDLALPVVKTVRGPDGSCRSAGGLWIELKSKEGRLRESQEKWRDLLLEHGQAWALCRSVSDFIETVTAYLDDDFQLPTLDDA